MVSLLLLGCVVTDDELHEALYRASEQLPDDHAAPFGIELAAIPAGSFEMGSDATDADAIERPAHAVTVAHELWLMRAEVTQEQWEAAMPVSEFGFAGCPDCPAENVSWEGAAALANVLSEAEGLDPCYTEVTEGSLSCYDGSQRAQYRPVEDIQGCEGYRLPTEAEWEYAARAGEDTEFAGSDEPDDVAWTSANAEGHTHATCTLDANAFGLCDMSGNVAEWAGDWYAGDWYARSEAEDPEGPETGEYRVLRGGSMDQTPDEAARVSRRFYDRSLSCSTQIGVRLARTVTE